MLWVGAHLIEYIQISAKVCSNRLYSLNTLLILLNLLCNMYQITV